MAWARLVSIRGEGGEEGQAYRDFEANGLEQQPGRRSLTASARTRGIVGGRRGILMMPLPTPLTTPAPEGKHEVSRAGVAAMLTSRDQHILHLSG